MQPAGHGAVKSDLEKAEIFGMPAAFIVLILVFGAVVAAGVPLLLSVVSHPARVRPGHGLVGQFYTMSVFVSNIITMMGLAVGIDYTLFIISRYREERARGLDKIDAIAAAGATAGRAVFFSGMTVMHRHARHDHRARRHHHQHGHRRDPGRLHHAAHGARSLLPAVLSLLGDRINALRVPLPRPRPRRPRAAAHERRRLGAASRTASCATR